MVLFVHTIQILKLKGEKTVEIIKLIGVLVVVVGFAMKLDSLAIILAAGFITGLVSGMPVTDILSEFGKAFVNNRTMCMFAIVMLLSGSLERNGLKVMAERFIKKLHGVTSGTVICINTVISAVCAAFNVSVGSTSGFVKPVIMPMVEGAIPVPEEERSEEHIDELKGMAGSTQNIGNFFAQLLFVGGSGAILVKTTMESLGYEVDFIKMARVQIPICIFALIVSSIFYIYKDKKLTKKYYADKLASKTNTKKK